MSQPPLPEELWPELYQAAFSAYVDAAQAAGHAHVRLSEGSRAATRAVVETLRGAGHVREPLTWEAVHGTSSGYDAGCRCEYCTKAKNTIGASQRHWSKTQGHNKVNNAK